MDYFIAHNPNIVTSFEESIICSPIKFKKTPTATDYDREIDLIDKQIHIYKNMIQFTTGCDINKCVSEIKKLREKRKNVGR